MGVCENTHLDGNGRTARIINASSLYHAVWKKMKSLPLSNAINNDLSGYYRSLEDSETQLAVGKKYKAQMEVNDDPKSKD